MFCPNCKYEYKEGVKVCAECNVALVEKLTSKPQPEYVELLTVFTIDNPAKIMVAKSLLNEAKINYYVKGESLVNLYGIIPVCRYIEIQVKKEDVEDAKDLLKDLITNK